MAVSGIRTVNVAGESSARPPEISFDRPAASALLLTRIDRKYLLQADVVADFAASLAASGVRALTVDGQSALGYLSDYDDTPDLSLYRAAVAKRGWHFKLRLRAYLDSGMHFLELKTRSGRGHNIKGKLRSEDAPVDVCATIRLGRSMKRPDLLVRPEVHEWLVERLTDRGIAGTRREVLRVVASLTPTARSVYTCSTPCLSEGSWLTADRDPVFCAPSGDARVEVPGVVVETKSAGRTSAADR